MRKQQMETVDLELLFLRSQCTMTTPFLTSARFSRTGRSILESTEFTDSVFLKAGLEVSWQFLDAQLGANTIFSSLVEIEFKELNCFFMNGLLPLAASSGSGAGLRSQSNNYSHEIRLKWSFTSILFSRSYVFLEILMLEGKLMEPLELIRSISRAMFLSSKGQNPNSISYRTTPSDQMSAFMVQSSPLSISGAMYIGEPSIVCERSLASLRGLQNPKSASFSTPLWIRMLLGLISLCMMLFLINIRKALSRSLKQFRALSSGMKRLCLISPSSVPPLQYQQTKYTLLAVLRISMNLTMCVVSQILDRVWIQFMVNSYRRGLILYFSIRITLMATTCSVFQLVARYTFPNSPSPITDSRQQFQIFLPMMAVITDKINNLNNLCYVAQSSCLIPNLLFQNKQCHILLCINGELASFTILLLTVLFVNAKKQQKNPIEQYFEGKVLSPGPAQDPAVKQAQSLKLLSIRPIEQDEKHRKSTRCFRVQPEPKFILFLGPRSLRHGLISLAAKQQPKL